MVDTIQASVKRKMFCEMHSCIHYTDMKKPISQKKNKLRETKSTKFKPTRAPK